MIADQKAILADISEMLHAILADFGVDTEITMDTTFSHDLEMESIDVVSLAGRLQVRYGNSVNFAHFVAGLDIDSVRVLRVGQLVEHIEKSLSSPAPVPAVGP